MEVEKSLGMELNSKNLFIFSSCHVATFALRWDRSEICGRTSSRLEGWVSYRSIATTSIARSPALGGRRWRRRACRGTWYPNYFFRSC